MAITGFITRALSIKVLAGVAVVTVIGTGLMREEATGQTPPRPSVFVILDQDGYSTGDCLADPASMCGRIIADGFCQTKGFKVASAFRRAEAGDVTGSVRSETLPARAATPPAFIVSCR